MSSPVRRTVHPAAWWVWAVGVAGAVTQITNPLLLVIAAAVVVVVVLARRIDVPWARSFHFFIGVGIFIVVCRVLLYVLIGTKAPVVPGVPPLEHVVVNLPTVNLPSWAQGITLLGPVSIEGLLGAGCEGLRLATMLLCVGAANALANPRRLLRSVPAALRDFGTAAVVAVGVLPQLFDSMHRVRRARELRGRPGATGLRGLGQLAIPLLQDTLDRSMTLAASMDARGFGTRRPRPARERVLTAVGTLGGLMITCVGVFLLLSQQRNKPVAPAVAALVVGLALCGLGLWLGGRAVPHTTYRPDPWGAVETLTAATGLACLGLVIWLVNAAPLTTSQPMQPLRWPSLPLVGLFAFLVAALPAYFTPVPPRGRPA